MPLDDTALHHVAPSGPATPSRKLSRHGFRQLQADGYIQAHDLTAINEVARKFAVAITPRMLDLIEPTEPEDPIARQFIPDPRELDGDDAERADPIGDHRFAPVPGIIHRYPDRALLMPIRVCPVYCRFCFRRETVGSGTDRFLSGQQLDEAIDYIAKRDEIWEVILSGGDPLLLSPRRLDDILTRVRSIAHVSVIRVHTRIPLVSPERITNSLVRRLREANPVFVVLHCNHPREFTEDGRRACADLIDAGIPMLSQTVLLKGINDNADTMTELMRRLVENRIKPYYLHHADLARGTGHFRTTVAQGRRLMAEMRGNLSGVCQPTYVLDIPGGHGKSPIGPNYLQDAGPGRYSVVDYQGVCHAYADQVPHDHDD